MRKPVSSAVLPLILAAASACTAPDVPSDAAGDTAAAEVALWRFDDAAGALQSASCPEERDYERAEGFDYQVTPLDLSAIATPHRLSGWVLESERDDFGGLSGMVVMASGTLLTVSDKGAFVWLTMEAGEPTGRAHYAKMRDMDGAPLGGKSQGDAEGLALRDGLALVSFERDHRILAFDLEACGANPVGVTVARVAEHPAGLSRSMRDNGGMEGLALLADGTLAAMIETRDPAIPYGRVRADGTLRVDGQVETFQAQAGTGIDVAGDTLYAVHRDYRPGDGNHVTLSATPLVDGVPAGTSSPLLSLDPSVPVDNFEAVSTMTDATGQVTRVYLLSDDNFNESQRTLLFALDLGPPKLPSN